MEDRQGITRRDVLIFSGAVLAVILILLVFIFGLRDGLAIALDALTFVFMLITGSCIGPLLVILVIAGIVFGLPYLITKLFQ